MATHRHAWAPWRGFPEASSWQPLVSSSLKESVSRPSRPAMGTRRTWRFLPEITASSCSEGISSTWCTFLLSPTRVISVWWECHVSVEVLLRSLSFLFAKSQTMNFMSYAEENPLRCNFITTLLLSVQKKVEAAAFKDYRRIHLPSLVTWTT